VTCRLFVVQIVLMKGFEPAAMPPPRVQDAKLFKRNEEVFEPIRGRTDEPAGCVQPASRGRSSIALV
jgi:hypothetical protein